MAPEQRSITPPARNPETVTFWEACNEHRLLIKRCGACGEAHYYPRALCPFCLSADTRWEQVEGRGTIYAFSVMRRSPVPFALAYITIPEGVSILTNIVDCDLDRIEIGQSVRVVFKPADDGQLVAMFTAESAE
ncbi:Zn-ribbon domain-containing OB-fold protein [Rhodoligotrophos ferricapiens]|uniref:Zn-ribbon domain-containing OB-fold protein n=1 Tax=Rhodoligotrophos ferricapiens TaxID=3069264 RepID=UPI00315C97F1